MPKPNIQSGKDRQATELTLFMLVTNRDCLLAHYSILGYRKLWKIYQSFVLEVYANCLSAENKARYFPKWSELPYVAIRDNEAEGKLVRVKGASFLSPEGKELRYEYNCEHCDEVWTREHQRAATPFWATVDADFEVLRPEFICEMMSRLRADRLLAGIATDHQSTETAFDVFSNEVIVLNERWHTWCCIYRQETARYLSEVSSFYYEDILPSGGRHAFDSYSNAQRHFLQNGFRMAVLPAEFQYQFIHYGGFSKNKSITEKNVHLYRFLAIAAKRGLLRLPLCGQLNRFTRSIASRAFDRIFARAMKERTTYDFDKASGIK